MTYFITYDMNMDLEGLSFFHKVWVSEEEKWLNNNIFLSNILNLQII